MKVLLVDNNDSFTYNLVQLLEESGLCDFDVVRYICLPSVNFSQYRKILISPGPGVPSELPHLKNIILENAGKKSILGVCLGLQAIVEAFGGKLINLKRVRHGEVALVNVGIPGESLFRNLPSPFKAGLYHSWAADPSAIPASLEITAIDSDGIIMAIRHRIFDVRGVQFHPESFISSEIGRVILYNWLEEEKTGNPD